MLWVVMRGRTVGCLCSRCAAELAVEETWARSEYLGTDVRFDGSFVTMEHDMIEANQLCVEKSVRCD